MTFIYLLQLGIHPVTVVSRLVQKQERDSTKGETLLHNTDKNNTKTQNKK
jgi:hypothetical protein